MEHKAMTDRLTPEREAEIRLEAEDGCDFSEGQDHLARAAFELLRELDAVRAERDDYKTDYFRRHKDAVDRLEKIIILDTHAERLAAALRDLIAVDRRMETGGVPTDEMNDVRDAAEAALAASPAPGGVE